MNTRNYLSTRHRPQSTQAAHDKVFFRTLIVLLAICILSAIVGKAYGQGLATTKTVVAPKTDTPKTNPTTPAPTSTTAPTAPPTAISSSSPSPSPYHPTESQADKLRIAQLEAVNAKQAWDVAAQAAALKLTEYGVFNSAVNKLVELCRTTEKDNKWPGDVGCDINQNPIPFMKAAQVQGQAQSPSQAQQSTTPTTK